MLSKCANPECSEIFRYLHEGKVFCLAPTLEVQAATGIQNPAMNERFWLCEQCSKEMTLVWDGSEVRLERLSAEVTKLPRSVATNNQMRRRRPRARGASAGREDR